MLNELAERKQERSELSQPKNPNLGKGLDGKVNQQGLNLRESNLLSKWSQCPKVDDEFE